MATRLTECFGFSQTLADYTSSNHFLSSAGSVTFATYAGAFGDYCCVIASERFTGNGTIVLALPATYTTFYSGFRMAQQQNQPIPGYPYYAIQDSVGNELLRLRWLASGNLQLMRGATVLATTTSAVCPNNSSFHYIELGGTLNATTGNIIVKVDGVQVLNFTGNVTNTGGTTCARIAFGSDNNNGNNGTGQYTYQYLTHIYFNDSTGTVNNNFLGDVRIIGGTLTGAGATTIFAPTGAATNWQVAKTTPLAIATIYNADVTPAVGDTDLFTFTNVPAGSTVLAVSVKSVQAKITAGTRTTTNVFRIGGTNYLGAVFATSTTPTYVTDTFDANISGMVLSVTNINAANIGYQIAS